MKYIFPAVSKKDEINGLGSLYLTMSAAQQTKNLNSFQTLIRFVKKLSKM